MTSTEPEATTTTFSEPETTTTTTQPTRPTGLIETIDGQDYLLHHDLDIKIPLPVDWTVAEDACGLELLPANDSGEFDNSRVLIANSALFADDNTRIGYIGEVLGIDTSVYQNIPVLDFFHRVNRSTSSESTVGHTPQPEHYRITRSSFTLSLNEGFVLFNQTLVGQIREDTIRIYLPGGNKLTFTILTVSDTDAASTQNRLVDALLAELFTRNTMALTVGLPPLAAWSAGRFANKR